MAGLQGPVVVDTRVRNFEDLALTVHCVPGKYLSDADNRLLCRRLGALFENQGATVETVDTASQPDDAFGPVLDLEQGPPPSTRLVLEIRNRKIDDGNSTLSWALSLASFTLIPAVDESTFALDVTLRDGEGFLLVQDALSGRMIRRVGALSWTGNRIADRLLRSERQKFTQDNAKAELSEDLYASLTQLVFNAKMRSRVLTDATGTSR